MGADQVWSRDRNTRGFTGRGIGVAVIDSGVAMHPDLQSRVVAQLDFTGEGLGDGYGHGTHIAGMVAGSGKSSGGQYRRHGARRQHRVAEGARPGRRRQDQRRHRRDRVGRRYGRAYGVRVINLSIGHPVVESYQSDPLNLAVQRAVKRGFVVVTSAGNGGRTEDGAVQYGSILSPANDPAVITVGAVDAQRHGASGPTT